MFWHQEMETLDRPALEALQLKRLRETVRRLERVPFYRGKFLETGLKPEEIKSAADMRRLPFTTAADLRENYPDGLLAVSREEVLRLHTSSGTTGKPKALFFSRRDVDNGGGIDRARVLHDGGDAARRVPEHDELRTFHRRIGDALRGGENGLHGDPRRAGDLGTPVAAHAGLWHDGHPRHAQLRAFTLRIFWRKRGLTRARTWRLRKAFVGAEPYTEETRRKIEAALGIDVYNSYGLTEMNGPGVAFECEGKCGMHVWEDNFVLEIINPATGEPVSDGETGELVLTSINREAMPLLRYRTRDLTSLIPGPCACGRTHRRIHRITGRSDDMLIVRGVNIFPQQIERVLMAMPQIGRNYVIQLEGLDDMTVKVELSPAGFDGQVGHLTELQNQVAEKLRAELWVRPKVDLVACGSLPVDGRQGQACD